MAFSAQDILNAFIESTAAQGDLEDHEEKSEPSAVAFGLRAPAPFGYVRVWGPRGNTASWRDCHIVVERYNGAVGVSREVRGHVSLAEPRPNGMAITGDEIGYSCGPGLGRFDHAIRPSVIAREFASAKDLVEYLTGAIKKAGLRW